MTAPVEKRRRLREKERKKEKETKRGKKCQLGREWKIPFVLSLKNVERKRRKRKKKSPPEKGDAKPCKILLASV